MLESQDYRVLTFLRTTRLSLLVVRFHPKLRSLNRQRDQSFDELSEAFEIGDLGSHLGHECIANVLRVPLPAMRVAQVPIRPYVVPVFRACLLSEPGRNAPSFPISRLIP